MATTVEALARLVRADVRGDRTRVIEGAEAIDRAGPQDITFVTNDQNLRKLDESRAGAVVVDRSLADSAPDSSSRPVLLVDDAHQAFMTVLGELRPQRPRPTVGISDRATVSPSAAVGADTNIHPGAVVGDDVVVGANCEIHPGVSIGPGCRIGDEVTLHPNVVLYHDIQLGNRVIIHACSVIGADGFGYRLVDGRHQRVPHFGTVRIENDVEIGACATVDRAVIGETVIGEGTKLDNLVVIAHNCEIGRHNAFVSQVGLAGSVTTEDYVICAGQVGVADHLHLGEGCILGAKAGVHKDVPAGETHIGIPARPAADSMKILMAQGKLPELRKTVRQLEERVAELTARLEGISPSDRQSSDPAA